MIKSKLMTIREALRSAGLDYVITRIEGDIAHVNVYVGDDK